MTGFSVPRRGMARAVIALPLLFVTLSAIAEAREPHHHVEKLVLPVDGSLRPVDLTGLIPLKLDDRAPPPATYRKAQQTIVDLGNRTLLVNGFRLKAAPMFGDAMPLQQDRLSNWGGSATLLQPVGPRDDIALTLGSEMARRRSAFGPQYVRPFRTTSATASLAWVHNDRFSLAAAARIDRDSNVDGSIAEAMNRAAGAGAAGVGLHMIAGFRAAQGATPDRQLALTLDLFRQDRRTFADLPGPHETGLVLSLRKAF